MTITAAERNVSSYLTDDHQGDHDHSNAQTTSFGICVVHGIVDEAFVALFHRGDGAAALVGLTLLGAPAGVGSRSIASLVHSR